MKASTCSASSPGSSEPNLATVEQREALRGLGVSAEEVEALWRDDGAPEVVVRGRVGGVPCGSACGTANRPESPDGCDPDRLEGMAVIGWLAGSAFLAAVWAAWWLL